MRITTYKTKLNEDKLNILIKEKSTNYEVSELNSPERIVNMMNSLFDMKNLAEEYAYMIALNSKQKALGVFEISHGTVNFSFLSPREIFIRALLCGGVSIILAHNHPSGITTPSKEDIEVTKRICDAGKLIGITLLDHIIIGDNYYSFKENNSIL